LVTKDRELNNAKEHHAKGSEKYIMLQQEWQEQKLRLSNEMQAMRMLIEEKDSKIEEVTRKMVRRAAENTFMSVKTRYI
jgi:hypothetical protein